jgi:hypothetical protein
VESDNKESKSFQLLFEVIIEESQLSLSTVNEPLFHLEESTESTNKSKLWRNTKMISKATRIPFIFGILIELRS